MGRRARIIGVLMVFTPLLLEYPLHVFFLKVQPTIAWFFTPLGFQIVLAISVGVLLGVGLLLYTRKSVSYLNGVELSGREGRVNQSELLKQIESALPANPSVNIPLKINQEAPEKSTSSLRMISCRACSAVNQKLIGACTSCGKSLTQDLFGYTRL